MIKKGVITGDVVNSTALDIDAKKTLIGNIWQISDELQILSQLDISVYRGDSFQILIEKPEETLKAAVLMRAGLRSRTTEGAEMPWDARISIGIGDVSYISEHLSASDGEAFLLSGRGLDNIGKKRLSISTGNENVDAELLVSTSFADEIISSWTSAQSELVWQALLYGTAQKEIAEKYGTSVQNVSKLLNTAKFSLIELYIRRFEQLIKSL